MAALICACGGSDYYNGGGSANATPIAAGTYAMIAFNNTGELYRLDPNAVVWAMVLDTMYDPGTGAVDLGPISGASYVPSRGSIMIGGGGQGACAACVLDLDTTTGLATLLFDASGVNNAIPDIAVRASDGAIFTTQANGQGFRSIDPATGVVTVIDPNTASNQGNALTFSGASETLYLAVGGIGNQNRQAFLYTVNPVSGATGAGNRISFVNFPVFGGIPNVVSMSENPDTGEEHALVKDTGVGGTGNTYLAAVSLNARRFTYIAMTPTPLDGLAWVPATSVP